MDFFIHTTKASDAAKLKKLQDDFKLAGLGFYWKVVELLMLCPIKVHFNTILTLREPPIKFNVVKAILNDYDLFDVDENNYVTLKVDKGNGIGEKSLESYLSFFFFFLARLRCVTRVTRVITRIIRRVYRRVIRCVYTRPFLF